MVFENIFKGSRGEAIARRFLRKNGFKIKEKNYQTRFGEIDIIATEGDDLVFIEVKTRHGVSYGAPEASVGLHKQRHITRAARQYLMEKGLNENCVGVRFDVVGIEFKGTEFEIGLVRGAFDAVE
ncbi:MAG: YraN family protein [Thermodesulfobacteriota bacterium]